MADYIRPVVDDADDDPIAIQQRMEQHFAGRIPGWEAQPGTPEAYLFSGIAIEHAENRRLATGEGQTFDAIARGLATTVYGFQPHDAAPASAASTWTFTDTAGYIIPAGVQITVRAPDGTRVGFEVIQDVTIPPGASATATGEVGLIAVAAGVDGNGLGDDPVLEDTIDGFSEKLSSIVFMALSVGGVDGETDEECLNRFARSQRLNRPHLVLPENFEMYAVDWVDPVYGSPVNRALALDLFNPADGTTNNEGMVTVAVHDNVGAPVLTGAKNALVAAMEGLLPAGMVVNVIDATYTTVGVGFVIQVYDTFDPAAVVAAAETAVADYLSPLVWGAPPFGDQLLWVKETVVDLGSIEAAIKQVNGVRRVVDIGITGHVGDVNLTGAAPLPQPGTITGSAV